MTAAAPSTALATIQPVFTHAERRVLGRFLAGYRGLTREAYALDPRQSTAWCRTRSLPRSPSAVLASSPSACAPGPPQRPGGSPPLWLA